MAARLHETMKRLLLLLAFSVSALAQTTTPILIPVLYQGGGQAGSDWYSFAYVNNFTSQTIDGHGVEFLVSCPIPEGCFFGELRSGDTGAVAGPQSASGLLLHVPADEADKFEIQGVFGEETRHRWGVQLPIVRERDFRTAAFAMPNVSLMGDFRTMLRIYGLEPGDVRVDLVPWYYNADPYRSRTVTLAAPADDAHPAFAQLDLQREFPDIVNLAGSVRLRIVPLGPRVWAFVTVTQNATNEVTVITSQ